MKAKDIFMYALGALIALGTIVLIIMLLLFRQEMRDVISLAVGAFIAAFGVVVSYFYGSSKGSADKNEMIRK